MSLLLISCRSSHSGFTKQKYTNLKPIKVQEDESKFFADLQLRKEYPKNTLNDHVLETDPIKELLDKAIKDSIPVLIRYDDQLYELEEPFYDGIYKSISGKLNAIDFSDYMDTDKIVFTVSRLDENASGQTEVFSKFITKYEEIKGSSSDANSGIDYVGTGDPDGDKTDNPNKEREPIVGTQSIHESRHAKMGHKSANVAGVALLGALLFILLSFISYQFIFAVIAAYLIFYVALVVAAVYFGRYRRLCAKRKVSMNLKHLNRRNAVWTGLVIMSIPSLFILFLVALAFILPLSRTKVEEGA